MGIGYGIANALSEGITGFVKGREQASALQRQRELEDEERRRRAEMDAFNKTYRQWQMTSTDTEAAERRAATQRALAAQEKVNELRKYAQLGDPKAIEELQLMGDPGVNDWLKQFEPPEAKAPVVGTPEWQQAQKFLTDERIREKNKTYRPPAGPRPPRPQTFAEYYQSQVNRGRIDALREGDNIRGIPGKTPEEIQQYLYKEWTGLDAMSKGGWAPPVIQRRNYDMFSEPTPFGQSTGREPSQQDMDDALVEANGDLEQAAMILEQRGFAIN